MSRLRVVTDGETAEGSPVAGAAKAAITEALADGMVLGVVIYETADGGIGRLPILAGMAAQRGLLLLAEGTFDVDAGEFAK